MDKKLIFKSKLRGDKITGKTVYYGPNGVRVSNIELAERFSLVDIGVRVLRESGDVYDSRTWASKWETMNYEEALIDEVMNS